MKNKVEDISLSDFKIIYSCNNELCVVLAEEQADLIDQLNRTENSAPHKYAPLIFDGGTKVIQWWKDRFSTNNAGATGYLQPYK